MGIFAPALTQDAEAQFARAKMQPSLNRVYTPIRKRLAQRAGLDPAKYAGHSLRAGRALQVAIAGASERSIMNRQAAGQ